MEITGIQVTLSQLQKGLKKCIVISFSLKNKKKTQYIMIVSQIWKNFFFVRAWVIKSVHDSF